MNHLRTLFNELSSTYVDTARLVIAHWKRFLPLILVPAILSFIITVSTRLALVNAFAHLDSINSFATLFSLNNLVVGLLSICSVLIQTLAVIALIYFTTHHEQSTIMESVEESISYLWKFICIAFFVFVISLIVFSLGYIPIWAISILVGFISKDAVEPVLQWLEFVPNILSAFAAMFFLFAPYILIEKNTGVMEALRESKQLIRKHVVRMSIIFGVAGILSYILTFTLLYVPRIGSTLSVLAIAPFSTIYIYIIYRNLHEPSTTTIPATPVQHIDESKTTEPAASEHT